METEYTKGFKAGLAWEQERSIKLLKEIITERKKVEQTTWVRNEISNLDYLIELIKGETNGQT